MENTVDFFTRCPLFLLQKSTYSMSQIQIQIIFSWHFETDAGIDVLNIKLLVLQSWRAI